MDDIATAIEDVVTEGEENFASEIDIVKMEINTPNSSDTESGNS